MKKEKPEISIVIPAYNEEKYLPRLLKSIKQQKGVSYEVIVADANSKDRTKEIAGEFGCKIVKGGLPPVGRNSGAKYARGKYLLFLDSDAMIPENYLKRAIGEMKERNLDLATSTIIPISDKLIYKIMHNISNICLKIISKVAYQTPGYCIFITAKQFREIGGFRDVPFEDIELSNRVKGKFGILSLSIYLSVRRIEKEGILHILKDMAKATILHKLHFNNIHIEKKWGDYN